MTTNASIGRDSDLLIIGSTVIPRASGLPRRLSPVYQQSDDPLTCLLPVHDEGSMEAPPRWSREPISWFNEQVEEGRAIRIAPPLQGHAGQMVIQFAQGAPPELVAASEVKTRLNRARAEALNQAAQSLAQNDLAQAEALLFYAARAEPDEPSTDPLPLMLLCGLCRADLPTEHVESLLERIRTDYPVEAQRSAAKRLAGLPALGPLYRAVKQDPLFLTIKEVAKTLAYLAIARQASLRYSLKHMREARTAQPNCPRVAPNPKHAFA